MDATLTCRGVTLRRSDYFTLGPLDLTLERGVTCLVGPNGAGKTTLFRIITGLETAGTGTVDILGGALGYLPQDPILPQRATATQFLEYVGWLQKVPRDELASAVAGALSQVGLTEKADQPVRALSGGMQRRLGIAQALVHGPGVVLLDEPTVGLDPLQRASLRETIARLGSEATVLVSTHLVEDVRGMADRVIVLRSGTVTFDGTVEQLEALEDPTALGDTPLERAITAMMGTEG